MTGCVPTKNSVPYTAGDSLCREHISAGLFYQLLDAMRRTGKKDAYEKWDKTLPILLLSGDRDPVGDFGKRDTESKNNMDRAGLKDVEFHLIPNARHDLFHEEKKWWGEENGGYFGEVGFGERGEMRLWSFLLLIELWIKIG